MTVGEEDYLHGGNGNDIPYGRPGNDILRGGAGDDFCSVAAFCIAAPE
ncbi:MAG: hypothetical protein ACNA7L_11345 [Roseinatronobacter sp.]